MQLEWTTRDGSDAVGLPWEGTYEATASGEIRELIVGLQKRLGEIPGITDASLLS